MKPSEIWGPLPNSYPLSREHLHQLAFFAVSPARQRAVGRMGLRPTPGGFGTPEFEGRVARVEGSLLVHEDSGNTATQKISTVREGAEFFGGTYEEVWFPDFRDPLHPIDPDEPLSIEEDDSLFIGGWFEFAFDVLDRLRAKGTEADEVSETQIWPEHFDAALEMGNANEGERASYGFSPGDGQHSSPYIYVAAWSEIDRSNPYWNDEAFNGASLGYSQLLETSDPGAVGLEFLMEGCRILHAGS